MRRKSFHSDALVALCQYLERMDSVSLEQLKDLRWIECQILRHLVYHFYENDLSRISNLPTNYWGEFERLEQAVLNLYDRYE